MKKEQVLVLGICCAAFFGIPVQPSVQAAVTDTNGVMQNVRTVVCTVFDGQGPVIGANVSIKGTRLGTITDVNGKATLSNVPEDATLVVSFMGYIPVEVAVGGRNALSVELKEDTQTLDEVVVVGYGTQKKVNLTGAVEQVTGEVFNGRPTANAVQMLQGAVPNLNITLSDGKPNRSASLNVRGTTSIGQGGSALVLIDGVEGSIDMLNPNDIESV